MAEEQQDELQPQELEDVTGGDADPLPEPDLKSERVGEG